MVPVRKSRAYYITMAGLPDRLKLTLLFIGCIVTGFLANANELQTKENGKHPCLYREGSKMYLPSLDLN